MRHTRHQRFTVRSIGCLTMMVVSLASASPTLAHPADEINERDIVQIGPHAIAIETTISVGALTLLRVWNDADRNNDRILDTGEREAFGAFLADGMTVRIDGQAVPVTYELGSLTMPETLGAFERAAGDASGGIVSARFSVMFDGLGAPHEITVAVHHYAKGFGGRPPDLYPIGSPELGVVMQGGNDVNLRVTTAADQMSTATSAIAPVRPPTNARLSGLQRLVRAPTRGPLALIFGVCVAALLGALHALTPGHGKTLVAAYLVGTKGRFQDALALGGVVTVTHTGSVIVLGVVTLLAAGLMTPERILPWMEVISSLAIVLVGAGLLQRRLRAARSASTMAYRRRCPAEARGAATEISRAPAVVGTEGNWHEHDDGTAHMHGWLSGVPHTHHPPPRRSLRGLILMGVSGGIVPCPDALAILLVAIAAGHIVVGICIILGFSLGLAGVLIALGALLIHTNLPQRFRQHHMFNDVLSVWVPTISAAVIVLIGALSLLHALAAFG